MSYETYIHELDLLIEGGRWVSPAAALVGAFVFGQVLAWVYERTYVGLSYSRGFSHTLVLVCISASILVLSMQFSLLAGLGLFGVLSMIRFRTDLKTSRDLVFVMGAACIGVASGVGAILEASLGTAVFASVALYLAIGPFGSRTRFDGVLRFRLPVSTTEAGADDAPAAGPGALARAQEDALARLLRRHCRRQHLLSTVDLADGREVEHVYQVKFFRDRDRVDLLSALRDELSAQESRLMLQDATAEY